MVEAFSYEDIYELLRTEKFATDLEKISVNDLIKIKEYLKSKEHLLKQELVATNILSSHKKAKIQMEIDNAIRALKDLYEIRERKIINRALVSTRTEAALKDTTNMLDTETKLYEQLLEILKKGKCDFFDLLEKAKREETSLDEPEPKEEKPAEKPAESSGGESQSDSGEVATGAQARSEEVVSLHKVKFLKECPEVFGEDLKKYGPFKEGDECELPEQLCSILEKQDKVERKV